MVFHAQNGKGFSFSWVLIWNLSFFSPLTILLFLINVWTKLVFILDSEYLITKTGNSPRHISHTKPRWVFLNLL